MDLETFVDELTVEDDAARFSIPEITYVIESVCISCVLIIL